MVKWFKEKWNYLKLFLSTCLKYLKRDKVDMYLFIITVVMFIVTAISKFEANVSPFVGLLIVWIASLIFRLGNMNDTVKELRS